MELVIAAAAACLAAAAAWALRGRIKAQPAGSPPERGAQHTHVSPASATHPRGTGVGTSTAAGVTGEAALAAATDAVERSTEIVRLEERILQREESLEQRLTEVSGREQALSERERALERLAEDLEAALARRLEELERLAGIGRAQARQLLLQEVEEQARHEKARVVRQVEEEARRDAVRRSRNILSACMQRLAASHAAETTVSLVTLPSDDMKGRIIGREGRNIRALESITGVDLIIDETPSAVVLSAFDPVRREIARLTLEKLIADGRIHPARIEEAFYQAKGEIGRASCRERV